MLRKLVFPSSSDGKESACKGGTDGKESTCNVGTQKKIIALSLKWGWGALRKQLK